MMLTHLTYPVLLIRLESLLKLRQHSQMPYHHLPLKSGLIVENIISNITHIIITLTLIRLVRPLLDITFSIFIIYYCKRSLLGGSPAS